MSGIIEFFAGLAKWALPEAALGGKEGLQMAALSKGLEAAQTVISKVAKDVKIGAEDFTLLGSISYWDNILGKMSDANQALGIAGNLGMNLKDSFKGAYASVVEMGITDEQLGKSIESFFEKTGRARILSSNQMSELAKMSKTFGAESLEIVTTYGQMGLSITSATSRMRNLIVQSDKFGVLPVKVSGILKNNIDKVNSYNFKNGVSALEKMAIYAAKTNTDMKGAFAMADKLLEGSIEGAMEMSTNLQLIGGSVGNMGDMAELMYIARNEPEKFQEMFEKAAAGMGELNEQTGEIKFNAEARQRLKAIAQATGQDFNDLIKQGQNLKKSMSIGEDLDSSLKGLSNYEELLTKVSGAAEKNKLGEWVVKLKQDGKEVETAVSALTQDQIKQISFTDESKGPEQAFENIAKSNEKLSETLQRLIDTLKVEALSTGAYEKFNVMARDAADNIKAIAAPFIDFIQVTNKTALENFEKFAKPLSEGNVSEALKGAGENLADAGSAVWGLTKDVGQMLYNIFANAAKFLAAGIEWGFRNSIGYLEDSLYSFYDNTFGTIGMFARSEESKKKQKEQSYVTFEKVLEGYDLKGVMSGTSFETWWNDVTGGKATSSTTTTSTTPNVTNTSVPEIKKEPEAIEKKLTSANEEKTKKVEVSFTNPITLDVQGNTSQLNDKNIINEEIEKALNPRK
jgi:signal transduction histidine kinase